MLWRWISERRRTRVRDVPDAAVVRLGVGVIAGVRGVAVVAMVGIFAVVTIVAVVAWRVAAAGRTSWSGGGTIAARAASAGLAAAVVLVIFVGARRTACRAGCGGRVLVGVRMADGAEIKPGV